MAIVGPAVFLVVNILAENQRDVSDLFAGKGTDEERSDKLAAIGQKAVTMGKRAAQDKSDHTCAKAFKRLEFPLFSHELCRAVRGHKCQRRDKQGARNTSSDQQQGKTQTYAEQRIDDGQSVDVTAWLERFWRLQKFSLT